MRAATRIGLVAIPGARAPVEKIARRERTEARGAITLRRVKADRRVPQLEQLFEPGAKLRA